MSNSHVPAWKRVGLKLKRPAEAQGVVDNNVPAVHVAKKPKLNGVSELDKSKESTSRAINLTRQNSKKNKKSSNSQLGDVSNLSPAPAEDAATATIPSTQSIAGVKRRKSVTFSPDAKVKDGPLQDLDLSEIIAEGEISADAKLKPPKKNKKSSPTEPTSSTSQSPTTQTNAGAETKANGSSTKPYLGYLDEYYNHRGRWRFNKNLQTQVLQNAFNMYRVPKSYDAVLKVYLSGLQGESRTRLFGEAQQIVSQIASTDAEKAKETTTGTGNGEAAELQETNRIIQLKLARAQMVVDLLEDHGAKLQEPVPVNTTSRTSEPKTTGKRSRGRKRRTADNVADEIDSNSDTGSSSSGSGSGSKSGTEGSSSDSGSGSGSGDEISSDSESSISTGSSSLFDTESSLSDLCSDLSASFESDDEDGDSSDSG